jgi:F420-non-reducing hydrogenase iron-sulfur subunit
MRPQFGIEPERLRLEWISASEAERLRDVVSEFTAQIRKLGPLRKVTPREEPVAA